MRAKQTFNLPRELVRRLNDHALATGTPRELTAARGAATLEQAFVQWIESAQQQAAGPETGFAVERTAPRRRATLLARSATRLLAHSCTAQRVKFLN